MPRIISLTTALTLAAVLASPSAGLASSAGATPAALRPVPAVPFPQPDGPDAERLTAALLTGAELPGGFAAQPDAIDDMFARIPAEIAACGKAGGVPEGTVYREYVRGANDEELLLETLAAPGAKAARASVAAIAGVLPGCAAFTRPAGKMPFELGFTLSRYTAPKIGDASAGIAFVMRVPALNLTVHGRLVVAAANGVHAAVLTMTEGDPRTADLEKAARSAVTKLKDHPIRTARPRTLP